MDAEKSEWLPRFGMACRPSPVASYRSSSCQLLFITLKMPCHGTQPTELHIRLSGAYMHRNGVSLRQMLVSLSVLFLDCPVIYHSIQVGWRTTHGKKKSLAPPLAFLLPCALFHGPPSPSKRAWRPGLLIPKSPCVHGILRVAELHFLPLFGAFLRPRVPSV